MSIPSVTNLPKQPWKQCPSCGALHNGAMEIGTEELKMDDGDALICIDCGSWGVVDFSAAGNWRVPTTEEHMQAMRNMDFMKALQAVAIMLGQNRNDG